MTANMIDVSAWQHPNGEAIDWHAVARSGIKAAMVKATEGTSYANPYLVQDVWGARAAGLLVGCYHFSHPGLTEPEEQAAYALGVVDKLPLTLGLANDFEVTEGLPWDKLSPWARGFHTYTRTKQHLAPLYLNRYFADNLPGFPWALNIWLASPGAVPRYQVWAWQSGAGQVPGVPGDCDVNILFDL